MDARKEKHIVRIPDHKHELINAVLDNIQAVDSIRIRMYVPDISIIEKQSMVVFQALL